MKNVVQRLGVGLLILLALVLGVAVIAAAIWRAYSASDFPPTPTVPSLAANAAFASRVEGDVEVELPGEGVFALEQGAQINAEEGLLVRVNGSGWLRLALANDVILFLDNETEIELPQIAGQAAGVVDTLIPLSYGRLLVAVALQNEAGLVVPVETGVRAEVITAALMGLEYEPETQRFDLHCLRGGCQLTTASGEIIVLKGGEHVVVVGDGEPSAIDTADFVRFEDLGDPGLVPTITPTPRQDSDFTPVRPLLDTTTTPTRTRPPTTTPMATATRAATATDSATTTPTPETTVTPTPLATASASPTSTPTISASATSTRPPTPFATSTIPASTGTSTAVPPTVPNTPTNTSIPPSATLTTGATTPAPSPTPTFSPPTATPTSLAPTATSTPLFYRHLHGEFYDNHHDHHSFAPE